jgi:hypothetical protein
MSAASAASALIALSSARRRLASARCLVSRGGCSRNGGGRRGGCGALLRTTLRLLPIPALLLGREADCATGEGVMTTTNPPPRDTQLKFRQAVKHHWVLFLILKL